MSGVEFDLLVIGGGINGAGIARDAALRGLSVCLVEQGDFCNATTRWSSRLIHGGLRYLEFGELGLVHESLTERQNLLTNAPHLVRPLPLLIPIYGHSKRGLNMVDFGLWVYDTLSIGRSVPGHRRLSVSDATDLLPALERSGLAGGALYYDAQVTFVERLVVENVVAAAEQGADVRTRCRVEEITRDGIQVSGVVVRDLVTDTVMSIRCRAVVNAAGPWVDRVLAGLDHAPPRYLGPTRGTHIVLPRFTGMADVACYAEARSDGRPFFTIPWNGLALVGTTDLREDGDPGAVTPTAAEVDYLLSETKLLFPGAAVDRDAVLYAYAGVRPLPRQGLREAAAITRRHMVRRHAGAQGLYSVIGGKITTFRHLAEEVVDQVVQRLGKGRPDCATADEPLPGGRATRPAVDATLAQFPAITPASREHLWAVYGARAPEVAGFVGHDAGLAQSICPHSHAIGAEVVYALRNEFATTIGDVLLRRCMAGLSPDLGRAALPAALAVARAHSGWDQARCRAEEQAYRAELLAFTPGG